MRALKCGRSTFQIRIELWNPHAVVNASSQGLASPFPSLSLSFSLSLSLSLSLSVSFTFTLSVCVCACGGCAVCASQQPQSLQAIFSLILHDNTATRTLCWAVRPTTALLALLVHRIYRGEDFIDSSARYLNYPVFWTKPTLLHRDAYLSLYRLEEWVIHRPYLNLTRHAGPSESQPSCTTCVDACATMRQVSSPLFRPSVPNSHFAQKTPLLPLPSPRETAADSWTPAYLNITQGPELLHNSP
jgi:hypothetical protein